MKKTAAVFFLLLPACISLLVLAAHFVRSGALMPTAICVFLMFGLFMYKPLAARLVQIALFLGTIEWISTAISLYAERSLAGAPATRMLIILCSVAAFTFLSIFAFNTRILKERFELVKQDTAGEQPVEETNPLPGNDAV